MNEKKWDVFISHASEDKTTVARPLADTLKRAGVRVWLDEHELKIGDSLSEKIDEGLSESRFGVVILSPAFLEKHWTKKELAGLRAKEEEGVKVILPVWHNVDKTMITQFSPILADALAVSTRGETDERRIEWVAHKIVDIVFAPTSDSPSAKDPSIARRLINILESVPDKIALIDFLNFHLVSRERRLGWRGVVSRRKIQLYGTEFDICVVFDDNHGGFELTLVSFTDVWQNPFEAFNNIGSVQKIRNEIKRAIANIRRVKKQLKSNSETWDGLSHVFDIDARLYEVRYYLFAGRRSSINSNKITHDTWSKLLQENRDITIKSYDYIIDAFLPQDGDKL